MGIKINTNKTKNNFKAIINYCFRVVLFLILNREIIIQKINIVTLPIFNAIFKFDDYDIFFAIGMYVIFFFFTAIYFLAKITGIFKKLDNLNICISFTIVFVLSVILNYSQMLNIQIFPLKFVFVKENSMLHILPFVFLQYKFFNFLTKKFPTPFEKIGYICSIEFFKDLAKKAIKAMCKEKNQVK